MLLKIAPPKTNAVLIQQSSELYNPNIFFRFIRLILGLGENRLQEFAGMNLQYSKRRPKKRICFVPCFCDRPFNVSGHDNTEMKCSGATRSKRNNKRMGLTHEASNRTGGSRGKSGSNSNSKAAAAQQEIKQHHFKSKRIFAATEGARTNGRATKQELLVESDHFGKHI